MNISLPVAAVVVLSGVSGLSTDIAFDDTVFPGDEAAIFAEPSPNAGFAVRLHVLDDENELREACNETDNATAACAVLSNNAGTCNVYLPKNYSMRLLNDEMTSCYGYEKV